MHSINSTDWDAIRGTVVGSAVSYTGTDCFVGYTKTFVGFGIYNTRLHRGFYGFDTGTAHLGSVVGGHLYMQHGTSFSSGTFGIVRATPNSGTELLTTDYDECGDLNSATEGASRIINTIGSKFQVSYFRFNSSGNSWINRAGTTYLGIRIEEDLDDIDPGDGASGACSEFNTGEIGTINGPFLYVVTVE